MGKIISNVLMAFYQPFLFVVAFSVLFMIVFPFAEKSGWKNLFKETFKRFKSDVKFRRYFYFVFFTTMILFKTLFYRSLWLNPLSDVIGVWGLYNKEGNLTTQVIENVIMFVPFTVLFFWAAKDKLLKKDKFAYLIWQSVKVSFIFSLSIELSQLIFRLGTFQLSDLFYNTLGGVLGGIIYYILDRIITHKNNK